MNRDMVAMMRSALDRGFELLVLTNAMRPMRRFDRALEAIAKEHPGRVVMRVSLDDYRPDTRDAGRGGGSFARAADGPLWRGGAGFRVAVAGRRAGDEAE